MRLKTIFYPTILITLFASALGYLIYTQHVSLGLEAECIADQVFVADIKAVDNFIVEIDKVFDQYEKNVPSVVEDAPRWRVLWNKITFDEKEAETLMAEHFKKIFEDKQGLLKTAIDTLQYNFEKNQNNALKQLQADVAVKNINIDMNALHDYIKRLSKKTIVDSNKILITSVITSIIAEELTRWGITAGFTFTTTVAGAATGGTAGSVVPIVGTGIGIVVGASVGYVTDLYFKTQFEKKLTADIQKTLNSARKKVKSQYKKSLYNVAKERNLTLGKSIEKCLQK